MGRQKSVACYRSLSLNRSKEGQQMNIRYAKCKPVDRQTWDNIVLLSLILSFLFVQDFTAASEGIWVLLQKFLAKATSAASYLNHNISRRLAWKTRSNGGITNPKSSFWQSGGIWHIRSANVIWTKWCGTGSVAGSHHYLSLGPVVRSRNRQTQPPLSKANQRFLVSRWNLCQSRW